MKCRVAFATCVQLGLSCIEEIYRIGGKLDLLITLKDNIARKKSGRIYLDEISAKHSIPLLKITNINDHDVIDALKEHKIDWLLIIGWSQIAKKDLRLLLMDASVCIQRSYHRDEAGLLFRGQFLKGLSKPGLQCLNLTKAWIQAKLLVKV